MLKYKLLSLIYGIGVFLGIMLVILGVRQYIKEHSRLESYGYIPLRQKVDLSHTGVYKGEYIQSIIPWVDVVLCIESPVDTSFSRESLSGLVCNVTIGCSSNPVFSHVYDFSRYAGVGDFCLWEISNGSSVPGLRIMPAQFPTGSYPFVFEVVKPLGDMTISRQEFLVARYNPSILVMVKIIALGISILGGIIAILTGIGLRNSLKI